MSTSDSDVEATQISLRIATSADLPQIDSLLQAAFARPTSFSSHVELCLTVQPDGLWVAETADRIVGTAYAACYPHLAYIGLMAVEPASQRQGLGRRLVHRVLQEIEGRGCHLALLDATTSGAPLYASLGFVEDAVAIHFELAAGVPRHRRPAGLSWARPTDLASLAAFDAEAFGADRTSLLKPLLSRDRRHCLVCRSPNGELSGYLFVRDNLLGPWVADSVESAERLLCGALSLEFAGRPTVLVPRGNGDASELVARHGFGEQRRLRHMRRGGQQPPGVIGRLFGQSSYAHG